MKRFLLLIVVVIATLNSCSLDNDTSNFYTEFTPIIDAVVPSEFTYGEIHEIFVSYNRPNNCYVFNNIAYQTSQNERTIAVVNTVYTDSNCDDLNEEIEVGFDVFVNSLETYVFKFYQGEDEEGVDQYLIMEVPVVE
jgi:hypothetical protein